MCSFRDPLCDSRELPGERRLADAIHASCLRYILHS